MLPSKASISTHSRILSKGFSEAHFHLQRKNALVLIIIETKNEYLDPKQTSTSSFKFQNPNNERYVVAPSIVVTVCACAGGMVTMVTGMLVRCRHCCCTIMTAGAIWRLLISGSAHPPYGRVFSQYYLHCRPKPGCYGQGKAAQCKSTNNKKTEKKHETTENIFTLSVRYKLFFIIFFKNKKIIKKQRYKSFLIIFLLKNKKS